MQNVSSERVGTRHSEMERNIIEINIAEGSVDEESISVIESAIYVSIIGIMTRANYADILARAVISRIRSSATVGWLLGKICQLGITTIMAT